MSRLMNTLQFKTTCLTFSLVFLTCIFCQTLYESDYQQNNILNRESKDVSLQCLLDETEALLKKKTSDLQNCIAMMDAYNENPCYGNINNIHFFQYFIFFFININPYLFCWSSLLLRRGFNILWPRNIEPRLIFHFHWEWVQTLLLLNIDYPQPLWFHCY